MNTLIKNEPLIFFRFANESVNEPIFSFFSSSISPVSPVSPMSPSASCSWCITEFYFRVFLPASVTFIWEFVIFATLPAVLAGGGLR